MDTNETINELKAVSLDLKNQALGIKNNETSLLKRATGIDLAVSQLEGILVTQLSTITEDQLKTFPYVQDLLNQVVNLTFQGSESTAQIINLTNEKTELQKQIVDKDILIADLQAQLDAVAVPVDPIVIP